MAIEKLSRGKAVGVDQLKDIVLKKAMKHDPRLKWKILYVFRNWINGKEDIPEYLMEARTIALSKEDGQNFQTWGKCRLIGVLSALFKMFEIIIHEKLKQ